MGLFRSRADHYFRIAIILLAVCIQIGIVINATTNIDTGGDMVFTYTLANNSYSPLFFNKEIINEIPNSDGWFDSEVLREWYLVNDYNRFDYAGVYWHQRIDVHPPLYYVLVHTICSLFPNTYHNLYAGAVNILGILIIDLLLILLFRKIFKNPVYAIIPILMIPIHNGFVTQILNLRMYILLAMVCFWYLYIHITGELDGWKRSQLCAFVICIVVGCMTHNYFYVYAFCVSLIQIIHFIVKKDSYLLFNYILCGVLSLMITLIIFPWMIWQVIFNQQNKHTEISWWTLEKFKLLGTFVNGYLFNNRIVIITIVLFISVLLVLFSQKVEKTAISPEHKYIWTLVASSTLFYLAIIFTLDGAKRHYNAPECMPIILLISAFICWVITHYIEDWRAALPLMLCLSIILMGISAQKTYATAAKRHSEYLEWAETARNYKDCDCLCIGMELQTMNYSFYEVAQFDEVKAIEKSYYIANDLNSILDGRRTTTSDIIMFIPSDLDIPTGGELLMSRNGMNCVFLEVDGE